jgi:hypothetical protein
MPVLVKGDVCSILAAAMLPLKDSIGIYKHVSFTPAIDSENGKR